MTSPMANTPSSLCDVVGLGGKRLDTGAQKERSLRREARDLEICVQG